MKSPSRLARYAAAAVAALALTGCASMQVRSYSERGADFTRYHTYAWGPHESFSTGDPRLDNNPFFQERVRADVDKALATRGFEKSAAGTPDLLIHYHASVSQRLDVNDVDRTSGDAEADDRRVNVYEAGTLMLDLVDTRTNNVIWRGWAEGILDGVIDNQEWMEQQIDKAVARILEGLPRVL